MPGKSRKHVARKLVARKHKGGKHKEGKHKSRKHKSRKHKSRKHKSRKHKSRKHKSRKHKVTKKGGRKTRHPKKRYTRKMRGGWDDCSTTPIELDDNETDETLKVSNEEEWDDYAKDCIGVSPEDSPEDASEPPPVRPPRPYGTPPVRPPRPYGTPPSFAPPPEPESDEPVVMRNNREPSPPPEYTETESDFKLKYKDLMYGYISLTRKYLVDQYNDLAGKKIQMHKLPDNKTKETLNEKITEIQGLLEDCTNQTVKWNEDYILKLPLKNADKYREALESVISLSYKNQCAINEKMNYVKNILTPTDLKPKKPFSALFRKDKVLSDDEIKELIDTKLPANIDKMRGETITEALRRIKVTGKYVKITAKFVNTYLSSETNMDGIVDWNKRNVD